MAVAQSALQKWAAYAKTASSTLTHQPREGRSARSRNSRRLGSLRRMGFCFVPRKIFRFYESDAFRTLHQTPRADTIFRLLGNISIDFHQYSRCNLLRIRKLRIGLFSVAMSAPEMFDLASICLFLRGTARDQGLTMGAQPA